MTGGAVLVSRIAQIMRWALNRNAVALTAKAVRAVMALQASGENAGALEKFGVRRAVWIVTDLTPIDTNGGVFIGERSALIGVAFQTRFFIGQSVGNHSGTQTGSPRRGRRSMRIVAVGAIHEAFVHAVLEGHRELRSNVLVTAIA